MASVLKVYNALKDISNKEQKGYITEAVFNTFAGIAQMNVYNELFGDIQKAQQIIRAGLDSGRDKSPRKMTEEDLSMYVREGSLSSIDSNRFSKPSDLSKIISIRTVGESLTDETRNLCEIVYDVEKMNAILGSNLSTPTFDFPVALVTTDIELFPEEIVDVIMTYYALPTSYEFGTTTISTLSPQIHLQNGVPVVASCRDFMIPDEYMPELVYEMCELLGIRVRDNNLVSFGARKEASE